MTLAHIRDGQIVGRYHSGQGKVRWADGSSTSPALDGLESPDGSERLIPVVEEVTDVSSGPVTVQTVIETVEDNRVFREVRVEDVPPVPNTEIHVAWLKAYLSVQGWRDELEAIVTQAGPIASALWESGTTFRITDQMVLDLWANHSASSEKTVQEVFDAAAMLRDQVLG
jgi:hypothetical protein